MNLLFLIFCICVTPPKAKDIDISRYIETYKRLGVTVIKKDSSYHNFPIYIIQLPYSMSDEDFCCLPAFPVEYHLGIFLNLTKEKLRHFKFMGKVTSCGFSALEIDQEILQSLKDFESLKKISFRGTKFTLSNPETIHGFKNIDSLSMVCCEITDEELSFVSKMENLIEIQLFKMNTITDKALKFFKDLKKIEYVDLRLSRSITDNGIDYITGNGKLKSFKSSLCQLITNKSMAYIARNPLMEELDIRFSQVDDVGFSQLSNLKELKRLELKGCHKLSDKSVIVISQFKKINILTLASRLLSDDSISYINKLKYLNYLEISFTGITNQGIYNLTIFSDLENVMISENLLFGTLLYSFKKKNLIIDFY